MTNEEAMEKLRRIMHNITARNTHGYGIHSPRLYDFVRYTIDENNPYYLFRQLEHHRQALIAEKSVISTDIKDKRRYDETMFRIVAGIQATCIVDIDQHQGLRPIYMSGASKQATCISLLNDTLYAEELENVAHLHHVNNLSILRGNIEELIEAVLHQIGHIDLLSVAPEKSIAVRHILNLCSEKMGDRAIIVLKRSNKHTQEKEISQQIARHPRITAILDLYDIKVLFLDPHLEKKVY
ncbi:MAG: hypothetical protein IJ680_02125, partial [Paludibacteraceae bacterium]|nr:hypothetical protein [Paludibacteraceae bacterium]